MDLLNKNLLIISNGYPNKQGSIDSIFVKTQVDELSKYFNKVYVIVPTPYYPKLFSYFIKGYNNRLNNFNYSYNNVNVYYSNYFKLPNKISSRTYNLLNCVDKIIKKNKIKFDLIHAHFTFPSGFVAVKIKQKYNKKLIVTGHGFDVYDFPFKSRYNKQIFKNVLNNCDFFITVSKKNLDIANSFVYVRNKSKIIFNLCPSIFKPIDKLICKKQLNLPLNKRILLHIGSYKVKIKNQLNLIKAINLLKEIRQDFKLYLIGSGPDELIIKDEIKKYNLDKYIEIVGVINYSLIPTWLNSSDLFILPSYYEGNPTVMFESLACGIPYVGTNVGGVPEVIVSDKYGFLYSNPNDFKILFNLINKSLLKKWTKKEILFYANKFSAEKIIGDILYIYLFLNFSNKEYKK